MPLPIVLGIGAAVAGVAGVGTGVKGAKKMKKANDAMKSTEERHEKNIKNFERKSKSTNSTMDSLGKLELEILNSFSDFSDTIEKIQNRPEFEKYNKDGFELPKYDKEDLEKVSVGAGVLLGGIGGAAAGTVGGFAAAGATTSAVMALGTATTGTAISSLSGAALTNATLAALGGGALTSTTGIAGGMALGTTILSAATLGIGLMVGGVIFNFTGGKLSGKADEAYSQMTKAELTINKTCTYLDELKDIADLYSESLLKVRSKYCESYNYISYVVNKTNKTNWNEFTQEEKIATQNSVLLVGLLYEMCKVSMVEKSEKTDGINKVNNKEIKSSLKKSKQIIESID